MKDTKKLDNEQLFEKMTTFLRSFDPIQIRYAGEELMRVIETVARLADNVNQPSQAIVSIRDALLRLDPTTSVFSNIHLILVKLALRTRSYNLVIPALDNIVLYFPLQSHVSKMKPLCDISQHPTNYMTPDSGLIPRKPKFTDVLEYFFCCGLIYMGLEKWEMAQEYLENAIIYPSKASAVSKIQVEAYKKWILIGLMMDGKMPHLPDDTSETSAKTYRTLAKHYESVAFLFETGTASRLRAEIDAGAQVWEDDGNTGIMILVLAEFQKWQIRNLSNIYSRISLPEVLSLTSSAEAATPAPTSASLSALISSMTANGSLYATLSTPLPPTNPAILTFSPAGGPKLTEADMSREMQGATRRVVALNVEMKNLDRSLALDKDYIRVELKQKADAVKMKGLGGGDHDMDIDQFEDEDVMGSF